MQFKIPKFGFKFKKRGNAAGFFGAKLSIISNHLSIINDKLFQNNHLSIISNKLSQNNHLSIINDKLSKKRINYKLSIFGKKIFINYKLLIAVGVLALAGVGGTLALNGFFGGGAAIPEDTMTRGLVGYWSFDEGDGTVARDASGNNNHGTLTNGPQWTKGKNGTALQFDGKDDYVEVGNNNIQGNENITSIETWFKVNQIEGYQWVVGKYTSSSGGKVTYPLALTVSPEGNLQARLYDNVDCVAGSGVCYAQSQISAGEWYHVIATLDTSLPSENIKLYINGRLVKTGSYTGSQNSNPQPYRLGKYGTQYYYFDGQADEVKIYNRALSAEEVKYHYNRGGPVAQWDMDEGSGSVINDKSGNGNDGTISGATWAQGKHGSALSFDGTDDYVDCGNKSVFNLTGAMTFAAWVAPGSGINVKTIVSKTGTTAAQTTFWMDIRKSNSWIYFGGYTSGGVAAYTTVNYNFTPGVWYYVAGTDDGTNLSIYVNGIKIKTATSQTRVSGSWNVEIGRRGSTLLQGWDGAIDDARIYNYARTEEEIRLDYNAGLATHLGPSGKTCSEDPAGCMDFGLAGHWDMDEGSGSMINDKSGNNNHGTLTNGPQWTKGKNGSALQFDGKDDYVNCGNRSSWNLASSDHAIELWFKTSVPNKNYARLIERFTGGTPGYGYMISLMSDGRIRVEERASSPIAIQSIDSYTDNKWHNLIYIVDVGAKVGHLYMDGSIVASDNYTGDLIDYNANLKIGGTNVPFNGLIDEVRIYNRALSEEEVRYHYNHGGPVAHWDMDEGSGSKINDKSGNGNHGTLVNGTTWTQGKHGSALSFDGVDDYVSVPNSSDLDITADESFSYSLWLKTTSTGCSSCHFLIKYSPDGYSLHFTGDYIRALVNDSDEQILSPTYRINDGNWHYVEVVFDRSTDYMSLYVDGIARSQTNIETIGSLSNLQPLSLMRYTTTYVNGQIDEVKIYDYARTEEEIRLDYNAGLATHLGPSGKTCAEDPAGCMSYGLVGYWSFDEGDGTVARDASGNNNHGTLTNGPQWTKGKNGTALQFDGKDDYVSVADSDSLTFGNGTTDGGFSIESWINYDLINSFNIARKTNEYWLTNSNCLRLYLYDASSGGVIAKSPICLSNTYKGKWVHLIVTYDGSGFDGINYYINGNQLSGGSSTGSVDGYVSMENTTNVLSIGSTTAKGKIDGVKIYNRALSAEEVRYHYNQGKPVAQWDFDEGEGARAFDVSGNNNTGVLTNGPTWVEGKRGSALSFDGVDDYVGCGTDSSLNIADSMTASAWIYPKTLGEGSAGHIVGRGGTSGWCLYVYTGNSLKLYAGTIQAVSSANSITLNQWQYATVVYDKQNVRFFVNGVEKGVTAATSSIVNTGSCVIGARTTAGDFDFNGYLDEVKVYNYARTAEQIMQDYNAGVATHLK